MESEARGPRVGPGVIGSTKVDLDAQPAHWRAYLITGGVIQARKHPHPYHAGAPLFSLPPPPIPSPEPSGSFNPFLPRTRAPTRGTAWPGSGGGPASLRGGGGRGARRGRRGRRRDGPPARGGRPAGPGPGSMRSGVGEGAAGRGGVTEGPGG